MLKIATWNVNSLRVRLPHVLDWLQAQRPDIVALQETKLPDEAFPAAELTEAGYRAVFSGQRTYNGVALLSREPVAEVIVELPDFVDSQRRVLGATVGGLRVLNLYVPNGQAVGSDKYVYKLHWLDRLGGWIERLLVTHPQLVVLGDFNIAPEDRDVHDPGAWAGQVLCSEPERAAFRRLLSLGLVDTFRLVESEAPGFTWWDYRAGAFRRNHGLRIDHILASPPLARRCVAVTVDQEQRRRERPSDHAPVVAQFDLPAGAS